MLIMKYSLLLIFLNVIVIKTLETLKFDKLNDTHNEYKLNDYSKIISVETSNLKPLQYYKIMVHYIASVI